MDLIDVSHTEDEVKAIAAEFEVKPRSSIAISAGFRLPSAFRHAETYGGAAVLYYQSDGIDETRVSRVSDASISRREFSRDRSIARYRLRMDPTRRETTT